MTNISNETLRKIGYAVVAVMKDHRNGLEITNSALADEICMMLWNYEGIDIDCEDKGKTITLKTKDNVYNNF